MHALLAGITGTFDLRFWLQAAARSGLRQVCLGCAMLYAVMTWTVALAATPGLADAPPPELRNELPGAQLAGSARLTYWGFDVYTASLWATPGFRPDSYARHNFALALVYLRPLKGSAIAKRSLEEMQRLATLSPAQAQAWQAAMTELFPDVKAGDRLTGINRPGAGVRFVLNGKPRGEVADAEFARLFFGIWLAQATSEPSLRQSLLANPLP